MTQVLFHRPKLIPPLLFKMLRGMGFQAVDMHFHTEYGMDSISHIPDVLRMCDRRGIGVAITDHNEIAGAVKAWKIKKNEFVIPGIEASTHEGAHSLYYFSNIKDCQIFFNRVVKPLRSKNPFFLPMSIHELMEKGRDYNAYISAAHPYGPGKIGIKKLHLKKFGMRWMSRHFDYVEGLNGSNLRRMNEKSIHWANFIHKPMTAGSDGHTVAELGSGLTLAYGFDNESFFESLMRGNSILLGKEHNIFVDAVHEIRKETRYFNRARKVGHGMFWVKEHLHDMKTLEKSHSDFHEHYDIFHANIKNKQEMVKKHKYYTRIGKGLFR